MSGLEAVGVVSSIVQIADLGARVALKLCTFCHKVKQAEANIQNLSKDISLTCTVLRQLSDNLKQDGQIQLYSQNAFKTAQEILDECGRIFRSIESAMDQDLPPFAASFETKKSNPFLKFSRKLNVVFKEPQLNVLQTNLDSLKNTMLLMLNVIIYTGQLKNREIETSKTGQKELVEILVQQKRESDQKFERLTRAIEGVQLDDFPVFDKNPVTINNDSGSPALPAKLAELGYLPEVTADQFTLISSEIETYSVLIKDILERVQTTDSLLAPNRHERIKQAILDAHARELRIFSTEYGEDGAQLYAKLCRGPLFDGIYQQFVKEEQLVHVVVETKRRREKEVRLQKVEPEKDQVEEYSSLPFNGEGKRRVNIHVWIRTDSVLSLSICNFTVCLILTLVYPRWFHLPIEEKYCLENL
jgi:hypothetical protein